MNISMGHFPPHAFRFKSGGGGGGTPILPAPPAPAASETSLEVVQAKQQARIQAKAKTGINSTIMASALGDASAPTQSPPKGNVLLGGGLMDFGYLGL